MASKQIAVVDIETDRFQRGVYPEPFCAEFYSDRETRVFWGPDCIDALCTWLIEDCQEDYIIYAHNGGKFDFLYMMRYINQAKVKIINGRLAKAKIGRHDIVDSWLILPFGLKNVNKEDKSWSDFDYSMMDPEVREQNKGVILEYLHKDCTYLHLLVTEFIAMFGQNLTIAGTAMKELKKFVQFDEMKERQDTFYRQWYFGGRVQCFAAGVQEGPWKCYDVNSEYPYVMKAFNHPLTNQYEVSDEIVDDRSVPWLALIECRNNHAFISRQDDGKTTYDIAYGQFYVTAHEYWAAVDLGLVDDVKIIECHVPLKYGNFAAYIDHFYALRLDADARGDAIHKLFYKFVMNSSYGKFGTNPENFYDYVLDFGSITLADSEDPESKYFGYYKVTEEEDYYIWQRPTRGPKQWYNVATAASITGAARSHLLRGLRRAVDVVYCDTDSVICRDFSGDVDKSRLGAWKHEATSDRIALAGRKLYAMFNGDGTVKGDYIKYASKGVRVSPELIKRVAEGDIIHWENEVPTYGVLGKRKGFIERNIRSTIVDPLPFARGL